jgi:hypothetical protein
MAGGHGLLASADVLLARGVVKERAQMIEGRIEKIRMLFSSPPSAWELPSFHLCVTPLQINCNLPPTPPPLVPHPIFSTYTRSCAVRRVAFVTLLRLPS